MANPILTTLIAFCIAFMIMIPIWNSWGLFDSNKDKKKRGKENDDDRN